MHLTKSEVLRRLRLIAGRAGDLRSTLATATVQPSKEPMAIRGHCGGGSQD
jgi:hypothetical protein